MMTTDTIIAVGRIDMLVDIFRGVCFFGGIALLAIIFNHREK